jgi:cell division topological specificity factor
MGLRDFFRRTPSSASLAKERLRIIVAQERGERGGPDYLPLLRRELLEVIRKYVNVDPEAVSTNL